MDGEDVWGGILALIGIIVACMFWEVVIGCILILLAIAIMGLVIWGLVKLYQNKWRKTFYSLITLIITIPLCFVGAEYGPHAWEDYRYKHSPEYRVSDMQYKLKNQMQLITTEQDGYKTNIQNLANEIREEKEQYTISSLNNATERIKYNVRLIQEMDAYYSELSRLKTITKSGLEEAIYMGQQLDAKKHMARVINDGKVLSKEVDSLLEKYGPYMEKYAIDPKKLTMKPAERIWQEIGR